MLAIIPDDTANQPDRRKVQLPACAPIAVDQRQLPRLERDQRRAAGGPQARRGRGSGRGWDAEAVEAAWAREEIARAVAEINDAAAALRWQDPHERRMHEPVAAGQAAGPVVWARLGGMWASITLVAAGMVGGLVLLLR